MATTVATLVMQLSYWAVLAGVAAGAAQTDASGGLGLLALGLALAPFVFVVAGWLSRHPNWPLAVMKAMGLFVAVGATLGLVLVWLPGAAVVATVAAYGAGAAVTLRREEEQPLRPRVLAVVFSAVWVAILLAAGAGPFGFMSGAVLPFAAVTFADEFVQLRAAARTDPT